VAISVVLGYWKCEGGIVSIRSQESVKEELVLSHPPALCCIFGGYPQTPARGISLSTPFRNGDHSQTPGSKHPASLGIASLPLS
jgi:hypothetical protein